MRALDSATGVTRVFDSASVAVALQIGFGTDFLRAAHTSELKMWEPRMNTKGHELIGVHS
jgi:hypothetical protein